MKKLLIKTLFLALLVSVCACEELDVDADPSVTNQDVAFLSDGTGMNTYNSQRDGPCLNKLDCREVINPGSSAVNSFYYFHQGRQNSYIYYGKHVGTGSSTLRFNAHQVNNNAGTWTNPGAVYFDGTLHVFHKGQSNSQIWHSYQRTGVLDDWLGNVPVNISKSFAFRNDPDVDKVFGDINAIVHNGAVYIAYLDIKGRVVFGLGNYDSATKAFSFTVHAVYESVVGATLTSPTLISYKSSPSASFNDLYVLFSTTSGGIICYKYYEFDNWIEQLIPSKSYDPFNTDFHKAKSGVSATIHDDLIYVAYRDLDTDRLTTFAFNPLDFAGYNPNNYLMFPPEPSYSLDSRPSIASDGSRLVVVYKENNSSIWHLESFDSGNSWTGGQAVGQTRGNPYLFNVAH